MNRNAVDLVLLQRDESQSAELRSTCGDEAELEPDQGIRRHSPLPLLAAVDILHSTQKPAIQSESRWL